MPLNAKSGKPLNPGRASTAFAVDWDGDGDLDLLSGTIDSKLLLSTNDGPKGELAFGDPQPLTSGGKPVRMPSKAGGDSAPIACDWDADGDLDLLVGSGSGNVYLFTNTAPKGAHPPILAEPVTLIEGNAARAWGGRKTDESAAQPPCCGVRVKLCAADYNLDGRLDLLVGDLNTQSVRTRGPLTDEETQRKAKLEAERRAIYDRIRREVEPLRPKGKPSEWSAQDRQAYSAKSRELYAAQNQKLRDLTKALNELRTHTRSFHGWVWLYLRKPGS